MFGEQPHQAALPRERPFEGTAAPRDQGAGEGFDFALYLFPELEEWLPLLRRLRLSPGDGAYLASLASRNGTDFQTELISSGLVGEEELCAALADVLGIERLDFVDPDRLIVPDHVAVSWLRRPAWHLPVKFSEKDGATSYLIVPERLSLGQLRRLIEDHPRLRGRLRLVAPSALRVALLVRVRQLLARQTTNGLFERHPDMSARIVVNAWQGSIVGAMLVAMPAALWLSPGNVWMALHVFTSFFFLACVGLRFAALASFWPRPSQKAPDIPAAGLPNYSVLVALYREAEVVPELVAALRRIDWPASKLEIKLVCEEDDHVTLAAIRALPLPHNMEVVEVPVFGPRTKPKALAYALALAGGDFVVLYDAEDHPHPKQLLHAWQKFRESPPEVVCVQAPLEIANRGAGIVARMFAFEYAALFRGMLPWLSGNHMLLPLGGTSNHFRRSILQEVDGWDPYNVTEDADLGMRLARFGYRTETIDCPTWEAGPDRVATWLPQRTRWFKGWMQTWLVHMRDPALLVRELGPTSFIVGQILLAGMVLSALAHPFLLFTGVILVVDLALARPAGSWKSLLLAVDTVNIACGYLSFLLLGWQTLRIRERLGFWMIVLFTPAYWMLMSLAAWRAVWQLWRKPHLWEKTPHHALRRAAPAAIS